MKKFLKKGLLNLLLTIFFISLSNTSTSYAAESTQPILIATDIVPDAAFTTAIEFAPSYIQTFLGASNITNVHCSEGISCSGIQPFFPRFFQCHIIRKNATLSPQYRSHH